MPERLLQGALPASALTAALLVVASLSTAGMASPAAPCQGPGAPKNTQTRCLTAIQVPGNPLREFDISFVNPDRAEYYFADRSNNAIDVFDTHNLTFKRRLGGFVGVALVPGSITPDNPFGTTDNGLSGPDGITSHGRWVYGGDGNSTLKVFDLDSPDIMAMKQAVSTGGKARVDEMALTTDGKLLLAANNADDPPFATLFNVNGDDNVSNVSIIIRIGVSAAIIPPGNGLSIEAASWDPKTKRFLVSVPQIANNPTGCSFTAAPFCEGGALIVDPANLPAPTLVNGVETSVIGAFDPTTNTGVLPLHACSPNGSTLGPNDNVLFGCSPDNVADNTSTLVLNAKTKNFANIGNITGADEVWFNAGDKRYYTGSDAQLDANGNVIAVLGVIDAIENLLIETVPQGSDSHSVAADSQRNRIFVPQAAPFALVGNGGDTTTVGQEICGSMNGCIAVYEHKGDDDGDDDDDQ